MSNRKKFMEDVLFLDSKLEYRILTTKALLQFLKLQNNNKDNDSNINFFIIDKIFEYSVENFFETMQSFYESFNKSESFFKAIEDIKLKIKLQETLKEKEESQKVNKI